MDETFHIFSGTRKNASWEEAAEGLSNAREHMELLARKKPGQYFLFSVGTGSVLARTETFSQPQRVPGGNDRRSAARNLF
jgi:hypothetical protein